MKRARDIYIRFSFMINGEYVSPELKYKHRIEINLQHRYTRTVELYAIITTWIVRIECTFV